MLAEVGHLDVLQVTLLDQVMSGNGITEKNIGLVERDGIEGILVGRVGLDCGVGITGPYLSQWQVVIHHAQAQARQAGIKWASFVLTGNQYRLINRVRPGKYHSRGGSLEAIGTTEQVYLSPGQGLHCVLAAGKTLYLNVQADGASQDPGNVGGQAFIVVTAGGYVERRVVRCRGAQHQLLFAVDPLALSAIECKVQN
ncbi:hypothetical protein D3C77_550940 [compost metagenome]